MADVQRAGEITAAKFQIAYDGDALSNHKMDVQQLAPALLAFGSLLREANKQINGDRAKINLLVSSEFEHKCFSVSFDVVQSVYEAMKSFLGDDRVRSAKEILEWLDLLSKPLFIGGVGVAGLFAFLKIKRGRTPISITKIEDKREGNFVQIVFQGDRNSVIVDQGVLDMSQNPRITRAVSATLAPLQAAGVDRLEFRSAPETPVALITRGDAQDIEASCAPTLIEDAVSEEPQVITANLRVYAPVYDEKAEHWRFRFGELVIYADVRDTQIAPAAIARGGAMIGDRYRVRLQITEHQTLGGKMRNDYKILEVLKFEPAPIQPTLFDDQEGDDKEPGP